jgi:hypothetical protein
MSPMFRRNCCRLLFILALTCLCNLVPGSADAATCQGGPNRGLTCFNNASCGMSCSGGPNNGRSCTSNSNCGMSCSGGPNNGRSCFTSADCGGYICTGWICTGWICG